MLGSGDEPGPIVVKIKVEHREQNLYHESTPTTQERMVSMLNNDYTAKILNLEEVIVTNVGEEDGILCIDIELPRKQHTCPFCGASTDRIHDYRTQKIKDIPVGRETVLYLRKRRYRCICGKRFFEKNPFLPRYYRMTSRLIASIIQAFRKTRSATDIAKSYSVSVSTALRYFDCVGVPSFELPNVLSIDEFKGNAGGQKYQTIITDPEHRKTLDILPNRFESDLIRYFRNRSDRDNVKYFVTDMNPHFKSVAQTCFPNAVIVADRFHVVRQAFWAMENVRKAEQKKLPKQHRIYFKRSRHLLMKKPDKLTDEDMDKLSLLFEIAPRLADAYRVKNEFLSAMHSTSSAEGRKRLSMWIQSVEVMDLPEFSACTTACHNWFQEILNSMDVPWTNGFTEGCNNKTKVLKRVSYGIPNFKRQRKRILFSST